MTFRFFGIQLDTFLVINGKLGLNRSKKTYDSNFYIPLQKKVNFVVLKF